MWTSQSVTFRVVELGGLGRVAGCKTEATTKSNASGVEDWPCGIQISAGRSRLARRRSPSESGQSRPSISFEICLVTRSARCQKQGELLQKRQKTHLQKKAAETPKTMSHTRNHGPTTKKKNMTLPPNTSTPKTKTTPYHQKPRPKHQTPRWECGSSGFASRSRPWHGRNVLHVWVGRAPSLSSRFWSFRWFASAVFFVGVIAVTGVGCSARCVGLPQLCKAPGVAAALVLCEGAKVMG